MTPAPCDVTAGSLQLNVRDKRKLGKLSVKVLYCTVLYTTVLNCIVQYCTLLYSTVVYCYCNVLYSADTVTELVMYCTVVYWYCTVLYWYYTVLHCTVL